MEQATLFKPDVTTLVKPDVKAFYEHRTGGIQYVVSDLVMRKCAIVDPVLDFDETSGSTATRSADAILDYVKEHGLKVEWILDTHPHADHFSAARYLAETTGAPMAIGEHVVDVQALWKDIYNWPSFPADGSQWDRLFKDGDRFRIGGLDACVIFSPGHTLASITYVLGDAAFIHDTIYMPDFGTARADFPGGSAVALWKSIQSILALPDETRLFTGHDYRPGGREPRWESAVAEQKRSNPHLANKTEAEFVALRKARDATLPMPKLIRHALQVNIAGGRLPKPEANTRCAKRRSLGVTMRATLSFISKVNRKKAEAASEFMKRLAHPNRLMIACALVKGERSVGELELLLKIRQPALSQQLAELREAGIVEARREVKQVFYRLSDSRAVALIATLHRIFCGEELDQAVSGADASTPGKGYAATAARSRSLAPPPAAAARMQSPEAARFARVMATDPTTT